MQIQQKQAIIGLAPCIMLEFPGLLRLHSCPRLIDPARLLLQVILLHSNWGGCCWWAPGCQGITPGLIQWNDTFGQSPNNVESSSNPIGLIFLQKDPVLDTQGRWHNSELFPEEQGDLGTCWHHPLPAGSCSLTAEGRWTGVDCCIPSGLWAAPTQSKICHACHLLAS